MFTGAVGVWECSQDIVSVILWPPERVVPVPAGHKGDLVPMANAAPPAVTRGSGIDYPGRVCTHTSWHVPSFGSSYALHCPLQGSWSPHVLPLVPLPRKRTGFLSGIQMPDTCLATSLGPLGDFLTVPLSAGGLVSQELTTRPGTRRERKLQDGVGGWASSKCSWRSPV